MNAHTMNDLRQMQSLPLSIKIRMTEQRIRDWVNEFGESGVYVSFSGGKDSTVLVDIVRNRCGFHNVPLVFSDTGLEYPEIREFVKTFDNVIWLKPDMTFKHVIDKYGYPVISKQVAKRVYEYRNAIKKGKDVTLTEVFKEFEGTRMAKRKGYEVPILSFHNKKKWKFLIDAPFIMSHRCCDVMKKNPFHKFTKETQRMPMTAQMAEESINRQKLWLLHGCNAFDAQIPTSNPMSFWTEQDVLHYIKENNIPICSVYGDIVPDMPEECDGQISIEDLGLMEDNRKLKTTGVKRTGCMFCGFGCHLEESPNRFERMKETHPKQYDYIMRPKEKGGLNYKEVIDWINEHGGLDIKY